MAPLDSIRKEPPGTLPGAGGGRADWGTSAVANRLNQSLKADICAWRNQDQNENQAITDGEILGSSANPTLFQGHTNKNSDCEKQFEHINQ